MESLLSVRQCIVCKNVLILGDLMLPYADGQMCAICFLDYVTSGRPLTNAERNFFSRVIQKERYESDPRYQRAMERLNGAIASVEL